MGRFLPPAASSHAGAIDAMLSHVHWMVVALFAGWALYYLYVLIRYRAGRQPTAIREGTRGRLAMFVFAGVVVAEAVLLIGSALPLWFERTSTGSLTGTPVAIRVIAEQFAWNVHYPGTDGQFGATSLSLVSSETSICR
jgi:cytochrome c oxidase subunit 2